MAWTRGTSRKPQACPTLYSCSSESCMGFSQPHVSHERPKWQSSCCHLWTLPSKIGGVPCGSSKKAQEGVREGLFTRKDSTACQGCYGREGGFA
jgi:hypothetical protein